MSTFCSFSQKRRISCYFCSGVRKAEPSGRRILGKMEGKGVFLGNQQTTKISAYSDTNTRIVSKYCFIMWIEYHGGSGDNSPIYVKFTSIEGDQNTLMDCS